MRITRKFNIERCIIPTKNGVCGKTAAWCKTGDRSQTFCAGHGATLCARYGIAITGLGLDAAETFVIPLATTLPEEDGAPDYIFEMVGLLTEMHEEEVFESKNDSAEAFYHEAMLLGRKFVEPAHQGSDYRPRRVGWGGRIVATAGITARPVADIMTGRMPGNVRQPEE